MDRKAGSLISHGVVISSCRPVFYVAVVPQCAQYASMGLFEQSGGSKTIKAVDGSIAWQFWLNNPGDIIQKSLIIVGKTN